MGYCVSIFNFILEKHITNAEDLPPWCIQEPRLHKTTGGSWRKKDTLQCCWGVMGCVDPASCDEDSGITNTLGWLLSEEERGRTLHSRWWQCLFCQECKTMDNCRSHVVWPFLRTPHVGSGLNLVLTMWRQGPHDDPSATTVHSQGPSLMSSLNLAEVINGMPLQFPDPDTMPCVSVCFQKVPYSGRGVS